MIHKIPSNNTGCNTAFSPMTLKLFEITWIETLISACAARCTVHPAKGFLLNQNRPAFEKKIFHGYLLSHKSV